SSSPARGTRCPAAACPATGSPGSRRSWTGGTGTCDARGGPRGDPEPPGARPRNSPEPRHRGMRRCRRRSYGGAMGRIFLIALAVFLAFFVAGWLFGILMVLLKWVLIIGLVAFGFIAVSRFLKQKN